MSIKIRTSHTSAQWALAVIFACAAPLSNAGILVSTLNSSYTGGFGGRIDGSSKHAAQFSTDAMAYQLTGATAVIHSSGAVNASLYSDVGGLPGVEVFAFDSHAANGGSYAPVDFSVSSSFILQPNTTYHLLLNSPTSSPSVGAWALADTSFVVEGAGTAPEEREYFLGGWQSSATGLVFAIDAAAVPEPPTFILMALGGMVLSRRWR